MFAKPISRTEMSAAPFANSRRFKRARDGAGMAAGRDDKRARKIGKSFRFATNLHGRES